MEPKGAATKAKLSREQFEQVQDLWATKNPAYGLLMQRYRQAVKHILPARRPSLAIWRPGANNRRPLTALEKQFMSMTRDITVLSLIFTNILISW